MVPGRLSKLDMAIKEIGMDIDLSTFRGRLELQKSIYLLQEAGQDLQYGYGWYLSGPYSRDLTRDLFELQEVARVSKPEELEPSVRALDIGAGKKARKLIEDLKRLGDSAYWLELAASLHFLNEHAYPRPSDSKQVIVDLQESKPGKFNEEDVKKVYELLRRHGFIKARLSE